jgi:hypothetical protein
MERRSGCGFCTDEAFEIQFLKAATTSVTHSGTPTSQASSTTVGLSNLMVTITYLKNFITSGRGPQIFCCCEILF